MTETVRYREVFIERSALLENGEPVTVALCDTCTTLSKRIVATMVPPITDPIIRFDQHPDYGQATECEGCEGGDGIVEHFHSGGTWWRLMRAFVVILRQEAHHKIRESRKQQREMLLDL